MALLLSRSAYSLAGTSVDHPPQFGYIFSIFLMNSSLSATLNPVISACMSAGPRISFAVDDRVVTKTVNSLKIFP